MGFLVGRHGLTIDNALAAEVVTADGKLLTVHNGAHPDLFWALRGGGGNFGVVTRLCLRLHEIDQVIGGMLLLPASDAEITGLIAAADASPEDLSVIVNVRIKAPPLPSIPPEHHGQPVVMARMAYASAASSAQKSLAPFRALAAPLADMVRPMRYPEMYTGPEPPGPAFSEGTNLLLDDLAEGEAETILAHLETGPAATAGVELRVLGGAMAPVDSEATAFGHRGAKLMVNIAAAVRMPHVGDRAEHESWTNGLAYALSKMVKTPAYSGFVGAEGEDGVQRAYPPATLKRLTQVKTLYDPSNLFRLSLNVAPDRRGS